MEVRPVLGTDDSVRAESACEELRAHGIKCDTFREDLSDFQLPYLIAGPDVPDIQVVVAPEDQARAKEILDAWSRSHP